MVIWRIECLLPTDYADAHRLLGDDFVGTRMGRVFVLWIRSMLNAGGTSYPDLNSGWAGIFDL